MLQNGNFIETNNIKIYYMIWTNEHNRVNVLWIATEWELQGRKWVKIYNEKWSKEIKAL